MTQFKPLLSANIQDGDPQKLTWPLWCSPKLDGIRIVIHPDYGPVTRSLKPVRNTFIRNYLAKHTYLDGEVIVGNPCDPKVFNSTQSAVQTEAGEPDFMFHVFDHIQQPGLEYQKRHMQIIDYMREFQDPRLVMVPQMALANYTQLMAYEREHIEKGYEGVMARSPSQRYKFGRSTFNEQILLKVKRFSDAEAIIVGFEERQHNANEAVISELGYTKRSSHKANKVGAGTLGKFVVETPTWGRFSTGLRLNDEQKAEIWQNQNRYLGRQIVFTYFGYGTDEKPRFPIFKAFREAE